MLECEVCGAPAEVAWSHTALGVDFGPPNEAIFAIDRVNCANGCWYTQTRLVAKLEEESQ